MPFKPMEAPRTLSSDVLIIGSGGAGLSCAIALHDQNVKVHVVGKCKRGDAHTILARGGINAALGNMDKADNWQAHAADTIRDGGELNDPKAVLHLCQNAPDAIHRLHKWGTKFHQEKDGRISQRFFGAARYRRACFVGDYTGKAILDTLVLQAEKRKIPLSNQVYIYSLLHVRGRVNGAFGIDIQSGKVVVFHAKDIVLATGGHSRIFNRSSSRISENNGDGIKLAYEVGAECMDMEMFQFHPTGMVAPKDKQGTLVTEAVRGEGGVLTNALGERFMKRYDPQRMELSARDVVARAIFTEIEEGRGTPNGGVFLDVSHRSKAYILEKLPTMYTQFKQHVGIDISKEPMEVSPTAHYAMGGLRVQHTSGKTSVPNLYAVGEVAAGVHGGNRLGGNSLAEVVVFGHTTGLHIAKTVGESKSLPLDQALIKTKVNTLQALFTDKGEDPENLRDALQKLMWQHVGVLRTQKKMEQGLKQLSSLQKMKIKKDPKKDSLHQLLIALDVKNMFPTCELVFLSALYRKESRAAHARIDYPESSPLWKKNIICTPTVQGIRLSTKRVPKPPPDIVKLMEDTLDYAHERHMLE